MNSAQEIAQKLGIDSAVLRQELRHVASERSATTVKATKEVQATDAERILIRALASFPPNAARRAVFRRAPAPATSLSATSLKTKRWIPHARRNTHSSSEGLHRGLATESLVEALLNAGEEIADVMEVPCSDSERRMLASILLKEEEELTAEGLEGACRHCGAFTCAVSKEQVQRELKKPGISDDKERMKELLREVEQLSRALEGSKFG